MGNSLLTPLGGNISFDLLWENSNPTGSFPSQIVQLSKSGYDLIAIEYANNSGVHYLYIDFFVLDGAIESSINCVGTGSRANFPRIFSIAGTSVTFGNCVDNTISVPTRIFGVRGVKL